MGSAVKAVEMKPAPKSAADMTAEILMARNSTSPAANCNWQKTPRDDTMPPMPTAYERLLDATIQHLEELKARGVRHVPVSPETINALAHTAPRTRPSLAQSPIADSQSPSSSPTAEVALPLGLPSEAPAPATAPLSAEA